MVELEEPNFTRGSRRSFFFLLYSSPQPHLLSDLLAAPSPISSRPLCETLATLGSDDDGGGAEPLHHAWYIRTVGLDDATIASIPVATHRGGGGGGGGGGGDCSVCLGEFGDGELVRLLPKCAHAFHLSCIDTWLRAHVSCPLCRSLVVDLSAAADDPPVASIPTPIAAAESDPTQSDSDDEEASQEEEEEEEAAAAEEIENRAAIVSPDLPLPGSELQAPIDPVIGRSVSMNSPHVGVPVAPEPEESELNSQEYQIVIKEKEKDLQANLSKSPATSAHLEMKRSLSSSSGRGFFFSRHGRARSSIFLVNVQRRGEGKISLPLCGFLFNALSNDRSDRKRINSIEIGLESARFAHLQSED